MSDPNFGVVIRRIDNEPRPVYAADLSTIGLIGPAPDADPTVFPLNVPVKFASNDLAMMAKIGESGYILDAVRGINDQMGETQFAARIVFVRTLPGASSDPALKLQQTIGNILGSSTSGTGLWAFLKSPSLLGFTPRLIGVPGYTGQMANTINTITIGTHGVGYVEGETYTVTFAGGGTNAVQATAHAVGRSDGDVDIVLDTPGGWYTTAPTVTVQASPTVGSGGTTALATATIAAGANPICAGLTPVLNQLLGHAVVESSGTSEQNDEDWRETLNSMRLIPVTGNVKIQDPASEDHDIVFRPIVGRVLGIAVRRDHEMGAPFHSWANQPIQGIVGPGREIGFSITDGANEGQELLGFNVGIVVRGEIGNDFALGNGGFLFVGTDNAGDDPLWQMYNVSRGRDYIHIILLRALRFYLGRFNITGHTVQAILNTMDFALRDLMADGHILGKKVYFTGSSNSAEEIRLGHLTVAFAAEEAPVLKRITTESSRYRPAIDAMVAQLEAQLNLAA